MIEPDYLVRAVSIESQRFSGLMIRARLKPGPSICSVSLFLTGTIQAGHSKRGSLRPPVECLLPANVYILDCCAGHGDSLIRLEAEEPDLLLGICAWPSPEEPSAGK